MTRKARKKKEAEVRDAYDAIRKSLLDAHFVALQPLDDAYDADLQRLQANYDAASKPLVDAYRAALERLQAELDETLAKVSADES